MGGGLIQPLRDILVLFKLRLNHSLLFVVGVFNLAFKVFKLNRVLGYFFISEIKLVNRLVCKACTGARLVQKVDSLIGQIAVGDIAFREQNRLFNYTVGHSNAVEALVIALNAHKHLFCLGKRGFLDRNGLETALQSRVLFDILAVLPKGGSADNLNFTAGKGGL